MDFAKTAGAILFGTANAFVPVVMAAVLSDLSGVRWGVLLPAIVLIAISSTFLGLFIAVSVSEVFETQTFSNFFRFKEVLPSLILAGEGHPQALNGPTAGCLAVHDEIGQVLLLVGHIRLHL